MNLLQTYPKFARLWLAGAISSFGDRFNDLAIPIYVYMLTGSAMHLGIAFAVQTVAVMIIGFFAGAIVDRLPRKSVLIGTDLFRFVIFLIVAFTTLLNIPLSINLAIIYFLAFASSAADRFYRPAKGALLPQLVDKNTILEVNALDQGALKIAMVLGYGAAGLTIEAIGIFAAFIFNALTFLLSAVILWSINHTEEAPEDKRNVSIVSDVKSGFAYTYKNKNLRQLVIISSLCAVGMGGQATLLLLFSHRILGSGDYGLAILEILYSVGLAIALYFVSKHFKNRSRGELVSQSWFTYGLAIFITFAIPALLLFAGVSNVSVLLATAALLYGFAGASNSGIITGVNTMMQEQSEKKFLARVFANYNVTGTIFLGIGQALAGLADVFGVIPLALFWSVWIIVFGIVGMTFSWDKAPQASENVPN